MSTGVTHGADTDRLRVIAADLSGSARSVMQVQHSGTQSMGALVESWAGPDTQAYAADWQSVLPALTSAAERLTTLARLLVEQADEQDIGSRGSSPSQSAPPTSKSTSPSPRGKGEDGWTPDLRAATPQFGVPGSGLNYVIDKGTDWASDVYVDHIRDNPFSAVPLVEWGLREGSDRVSDVKDQYEKKKTNPLPVDGPGIFLDILADELDTYADILHDPKGWWDNDASTLDKVGIVASVIPGLGIAGKMALKTTKEAFDVITKALKHSDDVKHVPTPRVWDDDLADLDNATKLKDSDDPLVRAYGENAETAQGWVNRRGIVTSEDVWESGIQPRGLIIEALNKGNLPAGFKSVDRLETVDGVDRVVSTKSLDASLPTYDGKPKAIESRLNGYLNDLDSFDKGTHTSKSGNVVEVKATDYEEKVLEVFLRPGTMSDADWEAVSRVRDRATEKGITMEVHEYP